MDGKENILLEGKKDDKKRMLVRKVEEIKG